MTANSWHFQGVCQEYLKDRFILKQLEYLFLISMINGPRAQTLNSITFDCKNFIEIVLLVLQKQEK